MTLKRDVDTVVIEVGEQPNLRTFKGVRIAVLLERTGVKEEAKRVVFTGADGCERSINIQRLLGDPQAIVAQCADDTFRCVIPSLPPSFWVKNLIRMEVE